MKEIVNVNAITIRSYGEERFAPNPVFQSEGMIEVVLKPQITFERPAKQKRDFTSYISKLRRSTRRRAD